MDIRATIEAAAKIVERIITPPSEVDSRAPDSAIAVPSRSQRCIPAFFGRRALFFSHGGETSRAIWGTGAPPQVRRVCGPKAALKHGNREILPRSRDSLR